MVLNRPIAEEINMRYLTMLAAAGLLLAPTAGWAADACGDYGTSVLFEDTPKDAAAKAKKEEKLVFVLHISGHFEDPKLT
jgi:hypothetical protein